MTRTNRLPGGDDKHNDRTRQPHHRASPTPRAGANFNRKWPSMDTTDDIRQPPPMPRPRPPLRRTKVVSSRRKTMPERRHHPIRRFGFSPGWEERVRAKSRWHIQEGERHRSAADIMATTIGQGFPPIHPYQTLSPTSRQIRPPEDADGAHRRGRKKIQGRPPSSGPLHG